MTAAERIETPAPLLKVLRDKLAKLPRPATIAQNGPPLPEPEVGEVITTSAADGRLIREGNAPEARAPEVRPVHLTSGDHVAQVGAFSSYERADALTKRLGGSVAASGDGGLLRVRLEPFATKDDAVAAALHKGYPQAGICRD